MWNRMLLYPPKGSFLAWLNIQNIIIKLTHLKLFVAKTDRGLFMLKHSNSQDYHGYTWHQLTKKDIIKQEEQAASRATSGN